MSCSAALMSVAALASHDFVSSIRTRSCGIKQLAFTRHGGLKRCGYPQAAFKFMPCLHDHIRRRPGPSKRLIGGTAFTAGLFSLIGHNYKDVIVAVLPKITPGLGSKKVYLVRLERFYQPRDYLRQDRIGQFKDAHDLPHADGDTAILGNPRRMVNASGHLDGAQSARGELHRWKR